MIHNTHSNARHLLLVAHGSRLQAANDEVRAITAQLAARLGAEFAATACAYLELAEPSIPDAIDACVASGAEEIVILPFFLTAGRHIAKDIPAIVAARQAVYPEVKLVVRPYLAGSGNLIALLAGLALDDAAQDAAR